jgi:hypothetical protein
LTNRNLQKAGAMKTLIRVMLIATLGLIVRCALSGC